MPPRRHRNRRPKLFELPSGKTVEVFPAQPADGPDAGSGALGRTADETREPPQLCPACASELVYPVAWRSAPADRWTVDLRCPNCERTETACLGQAAAERFDEELERGAEALHADLARLSRANMAEHVERFVAALEADAIQPSDF